MNFRLNNMDQGGDSSFEVPRYFQWEEELELAFDRTSETAPTDVRILGNDPVALATVGIGQGNPKNAIKIPSVYGPINHILKYSTAFR